MPYSKKPKSRKTTLWSLLSTLPVYTSVKANLLFTEKLSPIILRQLLSSTNAKTKSGANTNNASLIESISLDANLNKTTLNINCKNSAVVTQLRHSQDSLLENINQAINADTELSALIKNVSALQFKISAHSAPPKDPDAKTLNSETPYNKVNADSHFDANRKVRQSNETRKSAEIIGNFSEQINDPVLAESLKRLANTLKESTSGSSSK